MRFSKKSEYALRALLELAATYNKSVLQRHDIAKRQNIPVEYLEQILLALKRAGLLASRRGVNGGYTLIKSPEDIPLGYVIRLLDGPLAPLGCVSKTAYQKCSDCPYTDKAHCPIQDLMLGVRNAISDILDHCTLSEFAKGKGAPRQNGDHRPR
ncbi:MAG: RrF2 family transcriptional regulator [Nitrospiraceae bacterium]